MPNCLTNPFTSSEFFVKPSTTDAESAQICIAHRFCKHYPQLCESLYSRVKNSFGDDEECLP